MTRETVIQTEDAPQRAHALGDTGEVELSILMPCLNEAETVATCVSKAVAVLERNGIAGEVIVADNGSTDGSQELAEQAGARVVHVSARGYGSALAGGIAAARGTYVLFGDADDSYDFGTAPQFLEKLRAGSDLVMGNRFQGKIHPGAMPWHHKYVGNPVLTGIGRLFFRAPVGDFHCGLRAFRRQVIEELDLQTTGMEFASELVIKATLHRLRIAEIPIELRPDGRSRPPHLRSFRDGWRHLRFMLLFCPRCLFLIPGIALMLLSLGLGLVLVFRTIWIGHTGFGIHTLLVAGMLGLVGEQLALFALFAQQFAVLEGLHPPPRRLRRWLSVIRLEHGLIAGAALIVAGLALLGAAVIDWRNHDFGPLDPTWTMRLVIPATVALVAGAQTLFGSFLLSVLQLTRRRTSAL